MDVEFILGRPIVNVSHTVCEACVDPDKTDSARWAVHAGPGMFLGLRFWQLSAGLSTRPTNACEYDANI